MTRNERLEIMAAIILAGALPNRVVSQEEADSILENGPAIAWKLAKRIEELSGMDPENV